MGMEETKHELNILVCKPNFNVQFGSFDIDWRMIWSLMEVEEYAGKMWSEIR